MSAADRWADDRDEQQRISDAVRDIAQRRAVIEQAKGMLMIVYGVDADGAFDILRRQSQHHNVKLSLIAEQIKKDLLDLAQAKGPARLAFDGLPRTSQRRLADIAWQQSNDQGTNGFSATNDL